METGLTFKLDHFLILTEFDAPLADKLISLGFREGSANTHPGQGTSNRRFYFENSMFEFLWLHDQQEAKSGPGRGLQFVERHFDPGASPFGLIFSPLSEADIDPPFDGWRYEPDYLDPPLYLHVADNSTEFQEPLLVFMPFVTKNMQPKDEPLNGKITEICITCPVDNPSAVLTKAAHAEGLTVKYGNEHLLEVFCESAASGTFDMRPDLPVILHF